MALKVPSLLEQEKLDEERLLKEIEAVNQTLRAGIKDKLYGAVSKLLTGDDRLSGVTRRSFSFDAMESFKNGISGSNGLSDTSTAFGSRESLTDGNIITQNLQIEEVLKIIVVGDKGVGKSLFIDKVCGNKASHSYSPTIT
jgi:hypothetical protein